MVDTSVPFLQAFGRVWSRIVRLPLNQVGSLNKIKAAFPSSGRKTNVVRLLKSLPMNWKSPVDKISDTLKVSGRHIQVDTPFVEGEDSNNLQCTGQRGLYGPTALW